MPNITSARSGALNSNSKCLKAFIRNNCGRLSSSLKHFWQEDELKTNYLRFLVLLHQITRASVPLLELGERLSIENECKGSDYKILADYFSSHIQEELNHDVWFMEDMQKAGLQYRDITGQAPSPWVASLVGAQYYWMTHHDPVSLLGYIMILEGNPPGSRHILELQHKTQLHADIFRTYLLHGNADPSHLQSLYRTIDSMNLTSQQLFFIMQSALHAANSLSICIDNIECILISHHD